MSPVPLAARCRRWCAAGALLVSLSPLAAWATALQPGHAGHWTAPDRDGEGWVLELLDADTALLYWFTYDEAGNQRWLTAVGTVNRAGDEARLDFPQLVVTRGARFGPGFDPADVVREAVGSATLRFPDCDHARFDFSAFGQSASLQLGRLAHVMGTPCERPHGMTGRPVAAQAGLSGSWFDPQRSGEGYALQWINPDQAILTWYTYDAAGRQYWMIGEGRIAEDGRLVAQVHATRGARFGAAFDPDDVERFAWGQVALSLDCGGGIAGYASPLAGFGTGAIDLQRLTGLDRLPCPWRAPALGDLYDLELEELDSAVAALPGAVALGRNARLNDAGAVWTLSSDGAESRVVTLAPSAREWQVLGDARHMTHVWAAAQGEVLVTTRVVSGDEYFPVIWRDGAWVPLDPSLGSQTTVSGMAADGSAVLVRARSANGDRLILWNEDQGGVPLAPADEPGLRLTAHFAGGPAGPVVGREVPGLPRPVPMAARLWTRPDAPPVRMYGPPVDVSNARPSRWMLLDPGACAAGCATVFGNVVQWNQPSPPAQVAEPWYWLADGRSGLLGRLTDDEPGTGYFINAASHDGSLVAGRTGLPAGFSMTAAGTVGQPDWTWNGFVWTQHTGMVSLRALLDEVGLVLEGWRDAEVAAVSPDGLRLLLSGNRQGPGAPGVMTQGLALLSLVPRDDAAPAP